MNKILIAKLIINVLTKHHLKRTTCTLKELTADIMIAGKDINIEEQEIRDTMGLMIKTLAQGVIVNEAV